jgi:hypothetical protein
MSEDRPKFRKGALRGKVDNSKAKFAVGAKAEGKLEKSRTRFPTPASSGKIDKSLLAFSPAGRKQKTKD